VWGWGGWREDGSGDAAFSPADRAAGADGCSMCCRRSVALDVGRVVDDGWPGEVSREGDRERRGQERVFAFGVPVCEGRRPRNRPRPRPDRERPAAQPEPKTPSTATTTRMLHRLFPISPPPL